MLRSHLVIPRVHSVQQTDLKHICITISLSEIFLKDLLLAIRMLCCILNIKTYLAFWRFPGYVLHMHLLLCKGHHRAHIEAVFEPCRGSCFLGFLSSEQLLSFWAFVILSAPGKSAIKQGNTFILLSKAVLFFPTDTLNVFWK